MILKTLLLSTGLNSEIPACVGEAGDTGEADGSAETSM